MQMLKALLAPTLVATIGIVVSVFVHPAIGLPIYVLGLMDINGRAADYRYLSGFSFIPVRMAIHYGKSYCGRRVITSLFPVYTNLYRSEGYKWWHILPDDFPVILFNSTFWLNLAFGHTRGVKS